MTSVTNKQRLIAAGLDPDKLFKTGDSRLCPITLELFEDPVLIHGHSFELSAIKGIAEEAYSKKEFTFAHPITRKAVLLISTKSIEEMFERNYALKSSIDEYVTRKILKTTKINELKAALCTKEWTEMFDMLDTLKS